MEILLIIGIVGGVIGGALLIFSARKKEKKEAKPELKKEKSSKETNIEKEISSESQTMESLELNMPGDQINKKNEKTQTSSSINKEISKEIKSEEKNILGNHEDLKKVLNVLGPLDVKLTALKNIVKIDDFKLQIKDEEVSKTIVKIIEEIKKDFTKIKEDAQDLNSKTSKIIKDNKHLLSLLDASGVNNSFFDDNFLLSIKNLDKDYSGMLLESVRLFNSSSNSEKICESMIHYILQISKDATDFSFRQVFAKEGLFEKLFIECNNMFADYYGAVDNLSKIDALFNELKSKTKNAA